MAIKIKDLGALSAKFVRNAGNATQDYKDGVGGAGADWLAQTSASEPNYEMGVQDAIGRKAFGKGVQAAGASKYTNNAVALGSTRYQGGINNAKDAWARGFAPYAQVLTGLSLPPKGPRRSPQNQARSNAVAVALGAKRANG